MTDKCPTCGQPLPEPLPIRYRFLKVNKTPQEILEVSSIKGWMAGRNKYVKVIPMILCKGQEREG